MSQDNSNGVPFATPNVYVNSQGWGPTALPEQYVGVPFTPFGKGDRLGRVADFVSQNRDSRYGRYNRDNDSYYNDDDAFSLVDTSKTKTRNTSFKSKWQNRNKFNNNRRRDQEQKPLLKGKQAKYLAQHSKRGKQWRRSGNNRRNYDRHNPLTRDASVKVQADWNVIEQFDLSALTKMSMQPPAAEDLLWCGSLASYNDEYDRLSTKVTKKLTRVDDVNFVYATTIDDPVIEKFAQDQVGNVFATDELMAHLMSCTRSVHPWDLVFTRAGNMLFIDKREDSNLEMLTVNETSQYRVEDESKLAPYNTPEKLSIEATAINQSFQQQVLTKENKKDFENPNPFWDEETDEGRPAEIAYRYRKWDLGGGNVLVSRTELHGQVNRRGEKQHMSIYALNEWDSKLSGGVNWRQKIDAQRGAVLATELKNNAAKLGRWTAQSLVSGADLMKIGYVSRVNPRDPFKHVILATQFYKPGDFANQINLNQNNMWGILKAVIELMLQQDKGKYVLLKDPNKPIVRLYKVPDNTFEEEDEESDAEGEVGAGMEMPTET